MNAGDNRTFWNWSTVLLMAVALLPQFAQRGVAEDVPGQDRFSRADTDGDGKLSLDEYLGSLGKEPPKDSRRNYAVCDFDGSGQLSLDEFRCLPGIVPAASRGSIPDPLVDLAGTASTVLKELTDGADKNSDGSLDESEWPAPEVAKRFPAFAELPFRGWDRDGDGKVTEAERDLTAGIAFATRYGPTGDAIRSPQGMVLHVEWVARADKDQNGAIDEAEFVASYWLKPEERAELFKKIDLNQDGRASIDELLKAPSLNVDVLGVFLGLDKDLDGGLNADELLANKSAGATAERVSQTLAAFDDDGDGKLSFRDYRLAPIGNGYVTYYSFNRNDVDQDGWLSWKEFHVGQTVWCIGLAGELFRRFDRDEDGRLSLEEFDFSTPPSKVPVEIAARRMDSDKSGSIEWDEFLQSRANADPKLTRRNFQFVDFDGDDKLTLDEYFALPGVLPDKQRRPVPDPVAEMAAKARSAWDEHFANVDKNQDGVISQDEWSSLAPPVELRPLDLFEFAAWDLNGDGKIESPERDRFIAVAYGLTTADGTVLRFPQGGVLFTSYLVAIDTNKDGVLSREEFVPNHWLGKEKAEALFVQLDTDKNDRLSWRELAETNTVNIDTASFFLSLDKDLDGRLSPEEVQSNSSVAALVAKMKQVVPAFDDDGDGLLSYKEFRLCPFGAGYVTLRIEGPRDIDGDGELVWDEFFAGDSPAFSGIAWALFTRLDSDHNGRLSATELESLPSAGGTLPPRLVFRLNDKNQDRRLDREEYGQAQKQVEPKLADRNFRLVDFDADGALTLNEYLAIPGLVPTRDRTGVPDPTVELAKQARDRWSAYVATADKDGNQRISSTEWSGQKLPDGLFPLGDIEFAAWDRQGDGEIDADDAAATIDVAYGLRTVDGSPLRAANGTALYVSYIRRADKDGDGLMSKAEYLGSIWRKPDVAEPLFVAMDQDKNGQLDYREMATSNDTNVDVLGMFTYLDKDMDARLSAEEVAANASTGATIDDVARMLPAFDDDGDGVVSYREFVLMPFGPGYVVLTIIDKRDLDGDGVLSWREFRPDTAPALTGLAGEWFRRLDRDRNGTLDLKEFRFHIDPSKVPLDVVFQIRDGNRDGKVSWPELEPFIPAAGRPQGYRNFRVVDFDGNDALDLEELRAFPGLLPAENRGKVPDPVAELAAEALKSWQEFAMTADQNGDHRLSRKEWSTSTLSAELGPVGEIPFNEWDGDRDGEVSKEDAERLLAIAYGLSDTSGAVLRASNGWVLYTTFSRRMDQNGDRLLTPTEFIKNHWLGQAKATEIFGEMDENKDGQVSYGELARSKTTNIDLFGAFVSLDLDLDGLISPTELVTRSSSGATEARVQPMLTAFDTNRDGKFSWREYCLMPIGVGYVSYDPYGRKDDNNDGYLDWKEFFPEQGPLFLAMAAALFDRFDVDNDSRLGIDEFEFAVDPLKVPAETAFKMHDRDRNGRLAFSEVFTEVKPATGRPIDLERYQVRMARAEDRFQADDSNADDHLSPEEFAASRAAAAEIAERHRRAVGKTAAAGAGDRSDWLFPVFIVVDVVILLAAAWYFLGRRPAKVEQ